MRGRERESEVCLGATREAPRAHHEHHETSSPQSSPGRIHKGQRLAYFACKARNRYGELLQGAMGAKVSLMSWWRAVAPTGEDIGDCGGDKMH